MAGALFTSGNTRSDEEKAFGFELLRTADGIGEMGVATVNDDVALFEVRNECIDELVNGTPGFDEKDDSTGLLEF